MKKKLLVLLFLFTPLLGACGELNESEGVISKIEGCRQVKNTIIHLEDKRAFKSYGSKCEVLEEGVKIKFKYNNELYMKQIDFVVE